MESELGNTALVVHQMEGGEFEKAIQTLSQMIQNQPNPYWYCKRSEAHLRTGQSQKALEDAECAYSFDKSTLACYMKGSALLKMDRVELAASCFEEGKTLWTSSHQDNNTLKDQLQRGLSCCNLLRNASRHLGNIHITNEFECVLCLKLFYEPATLPCGHSFCRSCITSATVFNNKCPLCRTVFHSNYQPPVTIALRNILEKLFPDEYKNRALECAEEEDENNKSLPLFILSGICFPGETCPLHVFDPRYRIMLKRVMQGCRQFGLVQAKEDASSPEGYSIFNIGCCLEVTQCETLPDGRSLIQTLSIKRFKIVERSMVDGYWVARVQYLTDILPSTEKELKTAQTLIGRTQELVQLAISQNQDQQDLSQLSLVVNGLEFPTTPTDCNRYTSKICTLLPISAELKQPLLELDSCVDRLRKIIALLERVVGSSSCTLL